MYIISITALIVLGILYLILRWILGIGNPINKKIGLVLLGIMCYLLLFVITWAFLTIHLSLAILISIAAYTLVVISFRDLAKAKSRNPAWGWYGLLGFYGLIVFVFLKDYDRKWYYQKNNKNSDPVTYPKIISLINEGTIEHDTPVWKTGSKKWKLAAKVFRKYFKNSPPPLSIPPKYIPKKPRPDAPHETVSCLNNWSNSAMTGLIVGSIMIPLIGIILGIIYLSNSETSPERKAQSKLLLIIGSSALIIYGLLSFVSATIYKAFISMY